MCHHRHRPVHHRHDQVAAPPAPVAPPARDERPLRAADADRERTADALRVHAAAGRLDTEELAQRLEVVYAATYVHDLEPALAELPVVAAAADGRRSRRSGAVPELSGPARFVLALVVIGVVAAATGQWWLWWLAWPASSLLGHGPAPRSLPRGGART